MNRTGEPVDSALSLDSEKEWQRPDGLVVIGLLVSFAAIYFATSSGITSSNDGSHYALARTISENHAFTLNQFDDFAEGNDIAVTEDGTLYSDRPPGTAILASLLLDIGQILPRPPASIPSRHDRENEKLPYILLLPAFAGAGVVALLFAFLRQLGLARPAAMTAAVMFALGTIHWKYSAVLFSHAVSSFLVLLSLFELTRLHRRPSRVWTTYFGLGLALGYAVLVEYSNILLVLIVVLVLSASLWAGGRSRLIRRIGLVVLGGLAPAIFLTFYNWSNFGSPFRLSYAYAVNYPWAGSAATTFNFPLISGLQALVFQGAGDGWCDGLCHNQGFFLLSPLLLLALPGLWWFWKRDRWTFALTMGTFAIYLLLFAKHRTMHGFTADGRYLAPYLPLLALPLGFFVDKVFRLLERPLLQSMLLFLIYGLFFLSASNIFVHIGTSFNYFLEVKLFDDLAANPDNWRIILQSVFPNWTNLPLLAPLAIVSAGLIVAYWALNRWKQPTPWRNDPFH